MERYVITYVLEVRDGGDPSQILDAAHEAGEGLRDHLGSVGIDATVDEDETCVREAD